MKNRAIAMIANHTKTKKKKRDFKKKSYCNKIQVIQSFKSLQTAYE